MQICSIMDILSARERRLKERLQAVGLYGGTAVSIQLNIPGETKDSTVYRNALKVAVQTVLQSAKGSCIPVLKKNVQFFKTGPEALFIFDANAIHLKELMVEIEEQHPLGRLFDIDVYGKSDNPLSRTTLMLPARRCYVCDDVAKVCGRSQRHALPVIIDKVDQLITNYELKFQGGL